MVVASLMIGNLLQAGQVLDTKKEIEVVSLTHTWICCFGDVLLSIKGGGPRRGIVGLRKSPVNEV